MAEGGGVQAGNEREGVAVREVGVSVRVSILITAIVSCLSQFLNCVLNHVMCDRLESELELVCVTVVEYSLAGAHNN